MNTDNDLDRVWQCLETGDIPGAIRGLRGVAATVPLGELARALEKAARLAGFADLAKAAEQAVAQPASPERLYELGYACVERGIAFAAIPPLAEAVRRVPGSAGVRNELVAAYEAEARHGEAVALLEAHEAELRAWPDRYLLVYNSILGGDLTRARRHAAALPAPDEDRWTWAYGRVSRMPNRADAASRAGALDHLDLRGRQFALTGGVLTTLSPYGFTAGMTGRYAMHQDDHTSCLHGLRRLVLVLEAAGVAPTTVSLLDDRGGRIMGLAAADLLGVPTVSYTPTRPDTLVVAYRLEDLAPEVCATLRERAPGQVLYEHATCWTQPPAVSADVSGLLRQYGNAPWEEQLFARPDGGVGDGADTRPEADHAAEVLRAGPYDHAGDDDAPADPDEALGTFTRTVAGTWLSGTRDRVDSPGPVRSSRFA
ncbi:hypothetical protein B4N89_23125 [Embleya scabrispora]|uniref:Tetratricopeptide repeat protein n=1 Tax=Embleya scabrispora TaxID=159449 RepID=A0A1T3P2W8_9ACTN|nr:hypothetical protein [Embleya scabrispora]OPC83449.1 hypothetical protein B4N89_23125 [Embleya scabrispora]